MRRATAAAQPATARDPRAQAVLDARRLRVRAWRDVSSPLAGAYRSAFRGRGFVFEELHDYAPGDDAQAIEWKATARLGRPIVKRMREDRDLVLALLVDVSESLHAGQAKLDAVRRAAAALAAAATRAGDRVALASFSDVVHRALFPAAGPRQLVRVLRALADPRAGAPAPAAHAARTDAAPALEWAARKLARGALVVLLSDGFFPDPGAALARCAHRHQVVSLWLRDGADAIPPGLPPIRVRGAEGAGAALWREARAWWRPARAGAPPAPLDARELRRRGVEPGVLATGERLIPALQHFLEVRARRTR